MPGWLKALLIVAGVIVLLVLGTIGAGVYWWAKNKDALFGKAKEAMTEGRAFGRSTDNQGCVDEAISRYKKEPGFGSAIATNLFHKACLEASRPTPGFCNDVPKMMEFMKSTEWHMAQCRRVDLSKDNYCQQLFQPVQEFCELRSRKSGDNNNTNTY